MVASDKLFFWLFQTHPDRILELQRDLPAEAEGWRFFAPLVKALERRLDGCFQPPVEHPELPVVLLEAQMAADPKFLRRLYGQTATLVQQEEEIEHWRVVVICPHRRLNFGSPIAVAEFLRERVHWVELELVARDPDASPLLRALALLVQPEAEIPACSGVLQAEVAGTVQAESIADVIAAIVLARFNGRSIPELCAMGGITVEEFTQSVAYKEIFGQGLEEGRQEGEFEVVVRQLQRRFGSLPTVQQARIRALPLGRLQELAVALLDFQGPADLEAWLIDAV
ncbi:MAG: DUF2887 domain-containing protein [Cyanobacteriota bacterium]|nr:DUF2887 domain-containing protein [Cyanobacteriota bacterium]